MFPSLQTSPKVSSLREGVQRSRHAQRCSADPRDRSNRLPLIIGAIAGTSAFLLILGVILYLCLSRRRSRSRRANASGSGQKPYAFSTGIEGAKVSAIDDWRKNAAAAKPSPLPSNDRHLSFSDTVAYHSERSGSTSADGRLRPAGQTGGSNETHSRTGGSATSSSRRKAVPVLGHPYGSPQGSPPPEYPDFIPYRGPIEPPPSALLRTVADDTHSERVYNWPTSRNVDPPNKQMEKNPPRSNTRVEGWVTGVQAATTPIRDSTSDRSYASALTGSGKSDNDLLSPGRRRGAAITNERNEIPLTPYSFTQLDGVQSPTSSLSSAAQGETTTRAVRATGSIARIWPNNPVPATTMTMPNPAIAGGAPAPSSFRYKDPFQSTADHGDPNQPGGPSRLEPTKETNPIMLSPAHTRERRTAAVDSMQFAPTYTIAGNFISSPDQLIGSRFASSYDQPIHSIINPSSGSRPSSPAATVRRGVSIKSVKTMRSFFSALLRTNSSSGSPLPDTPALPGQAPAARPDSGIFPVTRNNSIIVSRQKSRSGRSPRRLGAGSAKSRTPISAFGTSPGGQGSSGNALTATPTPTPGSARTGGLERTPSFGTRYMDTLSQYELASTLHPWSATTHSATPNSTHSPPSALRLEGMSASMGDSPQLFIELNPNSPVTVAASRPGSEMTSYWR